VAKLAAARQAAFAALLAVERGAWSAEALASKSAMLDSRDAGLASDIVFGTLRRKAQLDGIAGACSTRPIDKLDVEVRVVLEMAAYQARFLDRVPDHAVVNDAVELARRAGKASAAGFVNAILRSVMRNNVEVSDGLATPSWLFERWKKQFGTEIAQGIAAASLVPPERFIRVGEAEAPEGAVPTEVAGCFVLPEGDPGPYRFQDISSQAVVPLLELQPGHTFLDVCAAPGNKTAQAMETPVRAIACELHYSRARGVLESGIPVVVADARQQLPFAMKFDRILVDAPCSGTGTLSRNPEIKWRLTPEDILDLQGRQKAILRNALTMLAPGGILVYSTCSLESEENEGVVNESGAQVVRTMHRIPGRDRGDGFFAAVLQQAL
jgi:16S rRNA (cytosine967-C5)-methyltransferase